MLIYNEMNHLMMVHFLFIPLVQLKRLYVLELNRVLLA